jgi:hypothetical protein
MDREERERERGKGRGRGSERPSGPDLSIGQGLSLVAEDDVGEGEELVHRLLEELAEEGRRQVEAVEPVGGGAVLRNLVRNKGVSE